METNNWSTRIRRIPHRVLDHPLSGAYAAWVGLANVALTSPGNEAMRLGSLSATGILGLALVAGRKYMVRNDVERKAKQRLKYESNLSFNQTLRTSLFSAFEDLYRMGGLAATQGLAKALPRLLDKDSATTPWGSDVTVHTNQDTFDLSRELVIGALYYSMQEPAILTGKITRKVQDYIVQNKPEWLAEYPHHFNRKLADHLRPGLIDVALGMHGLYDSSNIRREKMCEWLTLHKSSEPSSGVPDYIK